MGYEAHSNIAMRKLAILVLIALPLLSQRSALIRTNVDLVLVSATVTDRKGVTVNGLGPDQFTILEDKAARPILSFSRQEVACSVGVILDTSGSMRDKLTAATRAVQAFLDTANPEDRSFVMAVGTRPGVLSGFTADVGTLRNSLIATRAEGATALVDTIYLGLSRMRSVHNRRKALLVVSDGMDNHSLYSASDLLRMVQEEDVQIYTIGIAANAAGKKAIQLAEERRGLALLDDLANRTGGLSFTIENSDDVMPATGKISRAIRDEYVIGYRAATKPDSAKWRNIQVKVSLPDLRVYARRGYYAP